MSCLRHHATLLMLIYVYALLTWSSGALGQRRKSKHRNHTRPPVGLPFEVQQAYHNELQRINDVPESSTQPSTTNQTPSEAVMSTAMDSGGSDVLAAININDYLPRIPDPDESDCEVEIEFTRIIKQYGRCTRLGGINGPYICQSGARFDFQPECQEIIENRPKAVTTSTSGDMNMTNT